MADRLLFTTVAQDLCVVDLAETPAVRVIREAGFGEGYAWPTWSPDGADMLVSHGWRASETRPHLEVLSLGLSGDAEPAPRFRNADGHHDPIAPGVMHYSYWAPDGRRAIVVARGAGGLTVTLLTRPSGPDGDWSARDLIDGAPMFSAWSPDRTTLAVHAGRQLVLFDTTGDAAGRRVLTDQPRFRAPAWSPDGRALYYAAPGSRGQDLLWRSDPESGARDVVTEVQGLTAVLAAPAGDDLALLTLDAAGLGGRNLRLIGAADPQPRTVEHGQVLGTFWSPDGTRLFYVARAGNDLDLSLMRYDAAGGRPRALARFRPSPAYSTYFAFFDQYALSHALISPDGRWLSIGGVVAGNGAGRRPFAQQHGCYVLPADGAAPPRRVADGEIAFFAPGAPAPPSEGKA
jgi:Tol biopolymer transport system component